MPYALKGRLCGFLCDDCDEPLAGMTVRLYRPVAATHLAERAVAAEDDTFAFLSDGEVKAKADRLIAEVQTDADGGFEVRLEEGRYDGGPIELDLYCRTVPRPKVVGGSKAIQVPITVLHPRWDADRVLLEWEYCLPRHWWCSILAWFGVWSVCGDLTTCKEGRPIAGATVTAFDADCIQDDTLGSSVTDASGRFHIFFTADVFQKTPFSPAFNFEHGGPDLYFRAALGGTTILDEPKSRGRTAGRENVGNCVCVELCADVTITEPGDPPVWLELDGFSVHPAYSTPGASFSEEGYAGTPDEAYVFGGNVPLSGNCPLTSKVTGNALEYRFTIGEWTWPNGESPTVLPSAAPLATAMKPVTQIASTRVGHVRYTDGNGVTRWVPVDVTATDLDGWIKLDGRSVTVPMYNPPMSTKVVKLEQSNFVSLSRLLVLDSAEITPPAPPSPPDPMNPPKLASFPDRAQAGRSLTDPERHPVRRYAITFEVRDAKTLVVVHSDTLSAVVLDNTPVIHALMLEELLASTCAPLGGTPSVHVLYTVEHPHLRSYATSISNNSGPRHPAPLPAPVGSPTGSGAFTAGDFLFRGGAGGPHVAGGGGGVPVDVSLDPQCAYFVQLTWTTRHYRGGWGGSTQILYCK